MICTKEELQVALDAAEVFDMANVAYLWTDGSGHP